MKKPLRRSSDILIDIAEDTELKECLTYQYLLQRLGERAFGIVLIFFALPSALPFSAIPGISLVFSLPIAIAASQMIFARKTLWLPKIIREHTIPHKKISEIINKTSPYLKKIEFFLKPRFAFMTTWAMEILNGSMVLLLSLLLMLPIPFSNFVIASLIIIFSLGLVEKDGLFILIAHILSLLYIFFVSWVVIAFVKKVLGM